MPESQYHPHVDEKSPDSSRAKRRRLDASFGDIPVKIEAGSSISHRSLPRRLPSRTPSGQRSNSESEDASGYSEPGRNADSVGDDESISSATPTASDWSYELVIVQHPQRARACGFGDKDRRPLSPPPILRLYVRTSSGQLVHPSKVPIETLIIMVDLWSADMLQQRNVVMHPSTTPGRTPSTSPPPTAPPMIDDRPVSRPSTSDSRPMSSHYPTTGWGWSDPTLSPKTTISKPLGPSPLSLSTAPTLGNHLPVPEISQYPRSLINQDNQRPSSSPLPNFSPSYSTTLPKPYISQRPYTSPSTTLRPLQYGLRETRIQSVNLPPLARITETLPPIIPGYSHSFDISRDPTAISRPYTAGTSTSGGQLSTSRSDWTSFRGSERPSWSTESSRPNTDYSFGRTSTSTWNTCSISSDGREREKPVVTGWPTPVPPLSRTIRIPSTSVQERPSTSGQPYSAISTPLYDSAPLRPGSAQPWSVTQHGFIPLPRPFSSGRQPTAAPAIPRHSSIASSLAVEGPVIPVSTPAAVEEESEDEDEDEDVKGGSNFSRVLVGSVVAMCQRLTDEDGNEGLFFFTHDLAVRTEGSFRLKFSVTNLRSIMQGGPPSRTRSQVLAQAYSEPFTVYSAKKFPGVIPTTKLTSLFAAQNVRLPTRQKRTGRPGGEGEDDDIDGS